LKGFDAVAFSEPGKALIAAIASPPDLLVTDIAMPLLSGIDLAIKVRERSPGCKVLLHSGQNNASALLQEARKRGHYFVLLPKPCSPPKLVDKIRAAFEFDTPQPPAAFQAEIRYLSTIPDTRSEGAVNRVSVKKTQSHPFAA
jgi:DNA-binding NtrC family response regulator